MAPQVHIKARFIEVEQDDNTALGFDWYLGNFINGRVVANGGTAPSLNVPVSAANPPATFPGNTTASQIPASPGGPTAHRRPAQFRPRPRHHHRHFDRPNFRVVIHALEQRSGVENLAEPEVITTSGRQTQMRATRSSTIITGFSFQQGDGGATTTAGTTPPRHNFYNEQTMKIQVKSMSQTWRFAVCRPGAVGVVPHAQAQVVQPGISAITPITQQMEIGPMLDVVPYVLSDGYTINLTLIPSLTEFNGYRHAADTFPTSPAAERRAVAHRSAGLYRAPGRHHREHLGQPDRRPRRIDFFASQDHQGQGAVPGRSAAGGAALSKPVQELRTRKNLMIFVTATIVDPAGNRVHSDDELPFAQTTIPPQPAVEGQNVWQPGRQPATGDRRRPPERNETANALNRRTRLAPGKFVDRLLIIDGHAYAYRAFHAIRELRSPAGAADERHLRLRQDAGENARGH